MVIDVYQVGKAGEHRLEMTHAGESVTVDDDADVRAPVRRIGGNVFGPR